MAGTWIQTRSGKAVDLLDPRPKDIDLEDIAWSLAHTNRFNGHAGRYSVARHSVFVWELITAQEPPERTDASMWALLHDASEAYTGDVVSPLKRALDASLRNIEVLLQAAICERFDVFPNPSDERRVKHADQVLLATEAAVFFPETDRPSPSPWGDLPPPYAPYLERIEDARRFGDPNADFHRFMGAARQAGIA